MLSRKGNKPRGVRKVKTKFMPSILGAGVCSRVCGTSGSRKFTTTGLLTGARKVLMNVSSKTTLSKTVTCTGGPRGGNGAVMTLLPSDKSECCSAPLFAR